MAKQFRQRGKNMKKLFRGSFFLSILFVLLIASPAWGATFYIDSAKGVDTATGTTSVTAVKSMVGADKLTSNAKAGDSLVIVGTPMWGVKTGIDLEGMPTYSTKEGMIQHHLIPGGVMRSVIQIGSTIMQGTSTVSKTGEITTVIGKTEVKPVVKEVKDEKVIVK